MSGGSGAILHYGTVSSGARRFPPSSTISPTRSSGSPYIAKVDTKEAPFGQKTFGFSKGFLQQHQISALTLAEEAAFDEADLSISDEDWAAWGYEPLNWEEALNFNPATGEPLHEEA